MWWRCKIIHLLASLECCEVTGPNNVYMDKKKEVVIQSIEEAEALKWNKVAAVLTKHVTDRHETVSDLTKGSANSLLFLYEDVQKWPWHMLASYGVSRLQVCDLWSMFCRSLKVFPCFTILLLQNGNVLIVTFLFLMLWTITFGVLDTHKLPNM